MSTYDQDKALRGTGTSHQPAAGETPKQVVEETVAEARDVADEVSAGAGRLAQDARERAMSFAEDNKGRAAEQLTGVTKALNKAAEELDNNDQHQMAGYTRDIAGGLERMTGDLRDKGIDELVGTVGRLARQQPALFLGAAALAGFAASRFVKSSAPHAAPGGQTRSAESTGANGRWTPDGAAPAYPRTTYSDRDGLGSSYSGGK